MKHIVLQKVRGVLVAADDESQVFVDALKNGQGISFDATVRRNVRFHRKAFKLFRLAFDAWQETHNDERDDARVAFERFREWLLILAGHSDTFSFPDGSVQVRAKSIAWDRCDELAFNDLYGRVLDVCWDKVFRWARYSSAAEVEQTVNRLMSFG